MRDLNDVLEEALGGRYCETCGFCRRIREYCDVPQHQGHYDEIECGLADTRDEPTLCPDVAAYVADYHKALEQVPIDEILGADSKDLLRAAEAFMGGEPDAETVRWLRAAMQKVRVDIAEERV